MTEFKKGDRVRMLPGKWMDFVHADQRNFLKQERIGTVASLGASQDVIVDWEKRGGVRRETVWVSDIEHVEEAPTHD